MNLSLARSRACLVYLIVDTGQFCRSGVNTASSHKTPKSSRTMCIASICVVILTQEPWLHPLLPTHESHSSSLVGRKAVLSNIVWIPPEITAPRLILKPTYTLKHFFSPFPVGPIYYQYAHVGQGVQITSLRPSCRDKHG